MKVRLFSLFLVATTVLVQADIFTLTDGAVVNAPVLKENDTAVILDLGHEVLHLPKSKIASRETSAPAKAETAVQATDIYAVARSAVTRTISQLVKVVAPATVQVRTPSGLGSGFIISEDGYVITNNHVISGDYKIDVIVYEEGEKELRKVTFDKVELLAQSPLYDLALLKIHAGRPFPFVPLARRDSLEQGEAVFAVGSPLGLERSISEGIISVRNRVFDSGLTSIQHTAQINPGNSGGPLFNRRGEVVGVNNLKMASSGIEGIGFAIPIAHVLHFIANRDAYAFDPRNPNAGYRYLAPPGSRRSLKVKSAKEK